MRKANLEPDGGESPAQVAIDESVIQLDGERHWLYAAVGPEMNEFFLVGVYNRCVAVDSTQFIAELLEKHDIDGAPWLHAALDRLGCDFRHETYGRRNAVERVFKKVKHRTNHFSNYFRHATIDSAESWLKTLAFVWNPLI